MANKPCPYYDENIIHDECFRPCSFGPARVETQTFIWLLVEIMSHYRHDYCLQEEVTKFFNCHSHAMDTIAEAEQAEKSGNLVKPTTSHNKRLEEEIFNYGLLPPVMKREQLIYDTITDLQLELFIATKNRDTGKFLELLSDAIDELNERTEFLKELYVKS